jgi:tetratricopeptide (TPR) repeat protein
MIESSAQTADEAGAGDTEALATPQPTPSSSIRRRASRVLVFALLGLTLVCALAAIVAASGFAGAQAGQREAQLRSTATVSASLVDRLNRGNQLLREGNYALAEANFAYILQYQPDNYGVRDLMATAVVAQTPTPTPTPTPIVTDKNELLRLLNASANKEDWSGVISLADQLIALDDDFEREAVSDLKYQALVARGISQLNEDEIERGLYDLDQAALIRPLSDRIEGERRFAASYQNALYYSGADWDRSISLLEELYRAAPGYRDVGRRLIEAYTLAGDAFASVQNWCPAAEKYAGAIALAPSERLEQKRRDADTFCLTATPVGLTGTVGTSTTIFNTANLIGRLLYSQFDPATGQYRYNLYDSNSSTSFETGSGAQPLYRPSVSPDGTRTTYSLFQDGAAKVVIARADGSSAPTVLTNGTYPVWGPNGYIVYQGCTDQCGIHIINPDNPSDVRRLTQSASDINPRWSPGGDRIIYSSNVSGSWEIYTVSPTGQFQQLTGLGATSGAPVFSPDGSRVAFVSNRDGNWGVYVMSADGSNATKLIDLGPQHPSWQSDQLTWTP